MQSSDRFKNFSKLSPIKLRLYRQRFISIRKSFDDLTMDVQLHNFLDHFLHINRQI